MITTNTTHTIDSGVGQRIHARTTYSQTRDFKFFFTAFKGSSTQSIGCDDLRILHHQDLQWMQKTADEVNAQRCACSIAWARRENQCQDHEEMDS